MTQSDDNTKSSEGGCFENIFWLAATLVLGVTVLAFWYFFGIPLMQCEGECAVMIVTAVPK